MRVVRVAQTLIGEGIARHLRCSVVGFLRPTWPEPDDPRKRAALAAWTELSFPSPCSFVPAVGSRRAATAKLALTLRRDRRDRIQLLVV